MNTYYFLYSSESGEAIAAASRLTGGVEPMHCSKDALIPFIIYHSNCTLLVLDENLFHEIQEQFKNDKDLLDIIVWNNENWRELYNRDFEILSKYL